MSFPTLELVVKYKVESVHVRTLDGEVLKVEDLPKPEPVHAPPPSVPEHVIEVGEKLDPVEERQLAIIARHHYDAAVGSNGDKMRAAAEKMNVSWQRVQALLKKRWVVAEEKANKRTLIRFPKIKRDSRGVIMTPEVAAVAKRLIDERGMSVLAVSKKIGCSDATVRRAIE
jgi:hypothetical protein